MTSTLLQACVRGFLGQSPDWYKVTIIGFLILNPIVLAFGGSYGPTIVTWMILLEFIFTLAMALKCHPLQPGGLLAIEGVLMGLTSADSAYFEIAGALPVLLLLIFMLAGIYFLKDLLLFVFARILLGVRSPTVLALLFCLTCALLAAFLNAITVLAVVVTVASGFYQVFHKVASGKHHEHEHDVAHDTEVQELHRSDLESLRSFLRGLVMHGAIGAAVGGAMTPVGQPQNLFIARHASWSFMEFFSAMVPVMLPILGVALLACSLLNHLHWFGYGEPLSPTVRDVLLKSHVAERAKHSARERSTLTVQAIVAALLVLALVFNRAEVGLVGLLTIILVTSFTGVTDEHRIGKAFTDAMPFTALVVVFFVIIAMLHEQHVFEPVLYWALAFQGSWQAPLFYLANGLLSAISDNVFVATIYTTEIKAALLEGAINRDQFHALAVATNVGSNIFSIATPNGQAALLLLLTSALAPLIRLSYGRMVWMALPYAIALSLTGLVMVVSGQ